MCIHTTRIKNLMFEIVTSDVTEPDIGYKVRYLGTPTFIGVIKTIGLKRRRFGVMCFFL